MSAGSKPSPVRAALVVAYALALWLGNVALPGPMAGERLDPSWQQSLGRALREGLRFGVDVEFTYGPLGWFVVAPYDRELFLAKCVAWEIGVGLAAAGFAAACVARARGAWSAVLLAAALALPAAGGDAWAFGTIACVVAVLVARAEGGSAASSRARAAVDALAIALLATLTLVKFTHAIVAALGVLCAAFAALAHFGAARERDTRRAAALGVGYVAAVALLWVAIGQRLLDLPRWVASSLEIAAGFSAAMGRSGPARELLAALVVLAAAAVAIAIALRRSRDARSVAYALFAAGAGFVAFKAGYVRNYGNAITTLAVVPLFPLLHGVAMRATEPGTSASPSSTGWRRAALAASALAVLAGLFGQGLVRRLPGNALAWLARDGSERVVRHARALADLPRLRDELERDSERVRDAARMPAVVARVGSASIDLVGNAQGLLHANGLRWTPRPVFQSYAAYTLALQRDNARFLAGEKAPAFVLLEPETIDRRLPGIDDALALQVLARDYRPVLEERELVLFERRDVPRAPPPDAAIDRPAAFERRARFDEWVELPDVEELGDHPVLLAVAIEPTLLGRATTLAFRAAPVWMDVEDTTGGTESHRVLPELLPAGVLVRPLLADADDWTRWFARGPTVGARRVRFTLRESGRAAFFAPEIDVRLVLADELGPR